ncbi:esterase E4-like [Trichoplusia ni]|uniref:Esterase E4-like n=1 Tax=Trichoplusia ni TaxID=7111 RepID=A0A7E5WKE3_TRINI|nr:esterase E4-like [Trichoplusia ni]
MAGIKLSVVFIAFVINVIHCQVIVDTSLGKVEGIEIKSIVKDEKFYSFMGIPYGKAPIGELRFKAPEPHEGWTEVLSAKKEPKPCAQLNLPVRPLKKYGFSGQEDCLKLGIHTPKLPENEDLKMPVIVFLYNEYFKVSHNSTRDFGPDFIVRENVVFASINHRIGSLGFLAFEDEILPGNNGLRDIILGLKWIKENVHKFGGDPDNITLMGIEGGATLVEILLSSPKAKGLYNKAILQSGTIYNSISLPTKPKEKANALAKQLEKTAVTSSNLISELSHVSAMELVSAELLSVDADEGRDTQMASVPFGPVVEPDHPDAIMTSMPEDTPVDMDVPIMIGYNSREGIGMAERYLRKPQYLTFAERDFLLILSTRSGFHLELNSEIYKAAEAEIKDFYFEEGYVKISKPGEYLTYIADVMTFYPIDYALRRYANESNAPVYYYLFDYSGELNLRKNEVLDGALTMEGTWGANTGDELCYLFVCKQIRKTYKKILSDEDAEELNVIRNMVKLWTNFAKSGNPTPEGSPVKWVPATPENKECMVISDELEVKTKLYEDRIQFWENFIAKYKAMAVEGVVRDKKDEL